ncbi:coiled-coil domain-containing protein 172 isoform X2 [Pseudoliparis swirei]|uniref:coiled-coil domain-containing protein 172 isoform X2 n=1 Tax=Pseudoliparis swirei TaxID=2059687 RepID=UPI0024BDB907|nr:coiled-coil domain-containing protein 172 isoform X2 [Pseudoliparis swirei]
MSLDTLFQQILLTEQQHSELTQKNRKVKLAIIQLNEDIKSATEKNAKTCEELESKAQTQLEAKEEEQNFLREVSRFNADFSLRANGGVALASRAHGELLELQRELASLHEEMELMSRGNAGVRSVRKEQRALQITLQGLDAAQRDLDRQLAGAEATTHALQAESLLVGRRPLTDATCLRMRKELETHKEGELEILREALSSEIDFLKSRNVDGSQGREQR